MAPLTPRFAPAQGRTPHSNARNQRHVSIRRTNNWFSYDCDWKMALDVIVSGRWIWETPFWKALRDHLPLSGPRRVPLVKPQLRVGPLQQILGAELRASPAVLHHHLAINVAGPVGNEKAREIGQSRHARRHDRADFDAHPRRGLRAAAGLMRPVGNALARSPRDALGPHRPARLLVNARSADFAIADGTVKARPVMVEVERIEHHAFARLLSIRRLPAASVQYIVPCRVGARMASAARNDRCSVCAYEGLAAALLTRMSIGASRPDRIHHRIDRVAVADVASGRR